MSTTSTAQTRDHFRRIAGQAGLDFASLDPAAPDDPDHRPVNPLAGHLLPERVCRDFGIVTISYRDGLVTVAGSDPFDKLVQEVAATMTGRGVCFVIATPPTTSADLRTRSLWRCRAPSREPPCRPPRARTRAARADGADADSRAWTAR